MKRIMIAAVLLSAYTIGGSAHAACTGTGAGAGVSDIWRAQFGALRLTIRSIGSPLTVGQPPVTGAEACDDPSAGAVRQALFTLIDTSTDPHTTLCHRWIAYNATYDPFGFGTALGAGLHIDAAQPCGADGTWDPVTYAANVALGFANPARLRFPDAERDEYGASAGLGIGSTVNAKIWWTTPDGVVTLNVKDDYHASYARGVGVAVFSLPL